MSAQDPMIDIFVYETRQLLETLEDILLEGEKEHVLTDDQINEIFRIMHTIKGSAAMMSYDSMAKLAHAVEDLFSQIREKKARSGDWDKIFDIVLQAGDIIKADVDKIGAGQDPAGEGDHIVARVREYLELLTHRVVPPKKEEEAGEKGEEEPEVEEFDDGAGTYYKIKVMFEPGCQMESMRAFGIANEIKPLCRKIAYIPEDLMGESANEAVEKNGFTIYIQSAANPDDIKKTVESAMFLESSSIIPIPADNEEIPQKIRPSELRAESPQKAAAAAVSTEGIKQNFVSVNVNKIDKLMDLVGEIVTAESMVTKNPEIINLQIESFERAGMQLKKLINELQDVVMSVRMLPVSGTFHKMHRIVRDMSKKVKKDIDLVIIGEETEVDKNIIDHLSDPLMHLIRNAADHGLETAEERLAKGKPPKGTITLEARNTGGDVTITVSDDGKGLSVEDIIKKAIERGLTTKSPDEISEKEAYSYIFLPGFSTKDNVTEFSGRGVGMDVVRSNIEKVGGAISVESKEGEGSAFQIKIPLTLAIIEGMKLSVGELIFIIPMLSIQESFKPDAKDIFLDPDGNEMIMLRGECYSVLRLHRLFGITPDTEKPEEGILIRVETDTSTFCMFADKLLGEQQAVVKPLPAYIQKNNSANGMHGLAGCTILGDGSISLIIDINSLSESLNA